MTAIGIADVSWQLLATDSPDIAGTLLLRCFRLVRLARVVRVFRLKIMSDLRLMAPRRRQASTTYGAPIKVDVRHLFSQGTERAIVVRVWPCSINVVYSDDSVPRLGASLPASGHWRWRSACSSRSYTSSQAPCRALHQCILCSSQSTLSPIPCTYLWLVGNGEMGYNYNYCCNYHYYHSSIPYKPKVSVGSPNATRTRPGLPEDSDRYSGGS